MSLMPTNWRKLACIGSDGKIISAVLSFQTVSERRINRAYVHSVIKPLLPALRLGAAIVTTLDDALALVALRTYKH